MKQGQVNQRMHTSSNTHCLICGAHILRNSGQAMDLICLICRAAILDRIFHARRQKGR